MRFSSDFIEQVRDANNIVEIIGQYTDLKPRGAQHTGLCPFPDHNEKSPSFSVSDTKQVYHCFGCKKSGNIFTFLEAFNGFTFTDSVEFLARRASIALPEVNKQSYENSQQKHMQYRINKYAAAYFHRQLKELPSGHSLRTYLSQRGLTPEIIDAFKIGYAPEKWDGLVEFFKQKKVPNKEAIELGLMKAKKQGNGFFDMFRNRLIFPIISPQEDVLGFGGRVLAKDDKPKYLNSPEASIFQKGRTFYGLDQSGKYVRQEDSAVIVEGYMDHLALYKADIKNVVATLGTALTSDHVRKIKRYTSKIILMFDGDFAGQQAAERSLNIVMGQGLCPLAVTLPSGMDPDDYISANGADALKELVKNAEELFLILIKKWLLNFKYTNVEKLDFAKKVKPILESISDPALKSLYIKEVEKRISVDPGWLLKQLGQGGSNQSQNRRYTSQTANQKKPGTVGNNHQPSQVQTVQKSSKEVAGTVSGSQSESFLKKVSLKTALKEEIYILAMMLKDLESFKKVENADILSKLSSKEVKFCIQRLQLSYRQNPNDFDKLASSLMSLLERPEEVTGLYNFWSQNGDQMETTDALDKCLLRVEERDLKRQSAIITSQIKNGVSPEKLEQIMNIQRDRMKLRRQKNQINSAEGEK